MKTFKILMAAGLVGMLAAPLTAPALARTEAAGSAVDYSVGPQYDTTHAYLPAADFDTFVQSFLATFGGTATKQGVFQVTPTPSQTMSQLILSPVGTVSVFGFKTPIPYPFGAERTGYLVTDMDAAVDAAVKSGATRLITTFPDPIGRDVVVQWPGGVNMQLYWHTVKPNYAPLATVPENRVYLTPDAADAFIGHWVSFSRGKVVSDDKNAPGTEVGQPGNTIRRVRITSGFGKVTVLVSNGQIPWPYGRDMTGYEVSDLAGTLAKAQAAGVETLVPTYNAGDRQAAILRFPGGYVAEVHQVTAN